MGDIADIIAAYDAGFLDGEEARQYIGDLAEAYTREAVARSILIGDVAFEDEECDECREKRVAAETD